jgi:ATP-binding cassette subfamily B multidrug efflux pump
MFRWFESLVSPYPEREPSPAPRSFAGFMWACSEGMRPFILGMTLCTALIGAFEAMLFAMLGRVVDWLARERRPTPDKPWALAPEPAK